VAIDYAKFLALGKRLIDENGRSVTLQRPSQTLDDVARPWGPALADDEESVPVIAVFLDPDRRQTTSGDIQPTAQLEEFKRYKVLVSADNAGLPTELGTEWYILDGSRRLEIVISKAVKPGGTLIYYELEVRA